MTHGGYPDERDQQALTAAHAALATAGVAPRPGGRGYDVGTLAAAIYAHGWAYGIDLAGGTFRAEIRPQGSASRQPSVLGVGWTADVALAFALARALVRHEPATSQAVASGTDDAAES